ncbi:hypothetical protein [Pannonibacter tanglangensis]|uniref:Uncharacterized protein n=1 Tax=Pannonibacter tanglangensis TaxID=2750084 RepID=A0ABW9ZQ61_9HYPH|nr:hypothetical protein [Pannonibacter sp. XCT-34]NBN65114.1 hypothetical protein [Pannonibacter sp. XCT-34]
MVTAVKQGSIAFLLAAGLVLALVCLSFQAGQAAGPGRPAGDGLAHVGMDHPGPGMHHVGMRHVGMYQADGAKAPTSLSGDAALQASANPPCCPPAQMDDLCVTLCMMASSFLAPSFLAADAPASCQLVTWPAGNSDVAGLGAACEPPPPKSLA